MGFLCLFDGFLDACCRPELSVCSLSFMVPLFFFAGSFGEEAMFGCSNLDFYKDKVLEKSMFK